MKIKIDTKAEITLDKTQAKDLFNEFNHILIMNCGDEMPVTQMVVDLMSGVTV